MDTRPPRQDGTALHLRYAHIFQNAVLVSDNHLRTLNAFAKTLAYTLITFFFFLPHRDE